MFAFNRVVTVHSSKNVKRNLGHRGKKWSYNLPQYYSLVIESYNYNTVSPAVLCKTQVNVKKYNAVKLLIIKRP